MSDAVLVPLVGWGPDRLRELDAFFRLWARTDAGHVSYWHTGFMYAVTEDRKLVPLVRYSGLFRLFVEPRERAYRVTVADAVMFSDAAGDSDAPLDTFRNPITGRTVTVRHFFEGPFTFEATESAERLVVDGGPAPAIPFRRRRWQQFGSHVVVSRDIYDVPTPVETRVPAAVATPQLITLATFSASLAELRDSRSSGVANTILSQQFAGPLMPWLDMSDRAGTAVSCGTGQRIAPDLSNLPRALRARVVRVHPAILRSAEHWPRASP